MKGPHFLTPYAQFPAASKNLHLPSPLYFECRARTPPCTGPPPGCGAQYKEKSSHAPFKTYPPGPLPPPSSRVLDDDPPPGLPQLPPIFKTYPPPPPPPPSECWTMTTPCTAPYARG